MEEDSLKLATLILDGEVSSFVLAVLGGEVSSLMQSISMCPKDHADLRLGAACEEVAGTLDKSAKGTRPPDRELLLGMSGGRGGVANG